MSDCALRALDDDLWVADGHFGSGMMRGSTRMTVIRDGEGGLMVHSPLRPTPALVDALNAVGTVRQVVAPNNMHYLYLRPFLEAFAQAEGFVSPALVEKDPTFGRYRRLDVLGAALPHVRMRAFDGHGIGETLFLHSASRTLLTSDLFYNPQDEHGRMERWFLRGMGVGCHGGVPHYHRVAVKDRQAVREVVAEVAAWPFRRIIMAHGRIVEREDAPALFREAWAWV